MFKRIAKDVSQRELSFWMLAGPSLLLLSALFLMKILILSSSFSLLREKLWLIGFALSSILGIIATLLSYKEAIAFFCLREEKEREEKGKAVSDTVAWSRALLKQLNEVRVDNFQLSLLNEMHVKELNCKNQECLALKEELRHCMRIEKKYQQLKLQFTEKSEVLHQTRKDLFHLEGKFLVLQKERELSAMEENPEELCLMQSLRDLERETQDLECEIASLQEVVLTVLHSKVSQKRKSKKEQALSSTLELNF